MNAVIKRIDDNLRLAQIYFSKPPIVIGGMAMEYYGLRKAGADIDLIICDDDYQELSACYPEKKKDIWGDLGVVICEFEVWRSISLFDYDFYLKDVVDEQTAFVISLDRLLFTRMLASSVKKYKDDLDLIKQHYYECLRNEDFLSNALSHYDLYRKKEDGIVWAGQYEE